MNFVDMSQFRTLKELQDFAEKQFKTIMVLEGTIKDQREKVKHLEDLLNNAPTSALLSEDKEVEICKIEINRLYNQALREPLDDKQVRNLEILVKTLCTARGKLVDTGKDKKEKADLRALPAGRLIELAKSIKDNA